MLASTAMLQLDNNFPSLTFPDIPLPQTQVDTLPQVTQIDQIEELQAYHPKIDKLNDMFNPDPINHLCQSTTIQKHFLHCGKQRVYMKIQWLDTDVRQYIKLNNLRIDEPWLCICYAAQHNLMYKPSWEWIPRYIELDESLCEMIHTYISN